MKIYKPDLDDLQEILLLWENQYKYHNNLDKIYYVLNSKNLKSIFKKYIEHAIKRNKPKILVANDNNLLAGFITYEISKSDYFDTNIKRFGSIIELYVLGSHRRKGIGRALMKKAEAYFKEKKIKFMELQCSTYNKLALDFYKDLDYENRQSLLFKKI